MREQFFLWGSIFSWESIKSWVDRTSNLRVCLNPAIIRQLQGTPPANDRKSSNWCFIKVHCWCSVEGLKNRDMFDPIFNERRPVTTRCGRTEAWNLNVAPHQKAGLSKKSPWLPESGLCCALDALRFMAWPCAAWDWTVWSDRLQRIFGRVSEMGSGLGLVVRI